MVLTELIDDVPSVSGIAMGIAKAVPATDGVSVMTCGCRVVPCRVSGAKLHDGADTIAAFYIRRPW
jgi:hypothetical protein